jgi:hypothetical protein
MPNGRAGRKVHTRGADPKPGLARTEATRRVANATLAVRRAELWGEGTALAKKLQLAGEEAWRTVWSAILATITSTPWLRMHAWSSSASSP